MNNDNKPPARTEKQKPQDGKLQSYLEWPNYALKTAYYVFEQCSKIQPIMLKIILPKLTSYSRTDCFIRV